LIELGQRIYSRLEALPYPTVAAIHGYALGGGLELALACRYRVAVGDSKLALGLPEVQLGLHPGFGGTVRSVRLLGVRAAMKLMLTGRSVRSDQALKVGLVDRLVRPGVRTRCGRAPDHSCRAAPAPSRRIRTRAELAGDARIAAPALLRQVGRKQARPRALPGPLCHRRSVVAYGARGAAAYGRGALDSRPSSARPTARNLIRVFLLQDRLKALAGKSTAAIERVHVIGAGVMGGRHRRLVCAARP
jgi:3-hydroxyacyl-CoA dehydrogenase / enoyl-CoA hydratase / 3-hydroxybutyryl-CoA epimerase